MSAYKVLCRELNWGVHLYIFEYLSLRELHALACTCRHAVSAFLREKCYRSRPGYVHSAARFLASCHRQETVLLVSYPRSGNSFCRMSLEQSMGVVTGSDSRPNRTLSASLLRSGFRGEGIVDDSVWLVKSHYPERPGYLRFRAHRAVLLVRNPFDAIESYFHMGFTNTHDKRLAKEAMTSLRDIWERFVSAEAVVWTAFHEFWLAQSEVPLLVVRYEDFVADRQGAETAIAGFLARGKPPTGFPKLYSPSSSRSSIGYKTAGTSTRSRAGKALANISEIHIKEALQSDATRRVMERLGYKIDVATKSLTLEPLEESILGPERNGYAVVNEQFSIRAESDLFGRRITELRRSITKNDTEPFQTE